MMMDGKLSFLSGNLKIKAQKTEKKQTNTKNRIWSNDLKLDPIYQKP